MANQDATIKMIGAIMDLKNKTRQLAGELSNEDRATCITELKIIESYIATVGRTCQDCGHYIPDHSQCQVKQLFLKAMTRACGHFDDCFGMVVAQTKEDLLTLGD